MNNSISSHSGSASLIGDFYKSNISAHLIRTSLALTVSMEPLSRPPAAYYSATLSSLTEEPAPESTKLSGTLVQHRSQESSRTTTPIYDDYTSRSSVTFADISKFNSTLGSRLDFVSPTQDCPKRLEPPYHVFSSSKQNAILYLASVASIFSSLSSNIYFPALGIIADVRSDNLQRISY